MADEPCLIHSLTGKTNTHGPGENFMNTGYTLDGFPSAGRDHNPAGFTAWLCGAGVRAPFSYGATDEFGHKAIEEVAMVYDFHATILHLLALDHERLSYYHNGIERRLTDVHGQVIRPVLAG